MATRRCGTRRSLGELLALAITPGTMGTTIVDLRPTTTITITTRARLPHPIAALLVRIVAGQVVVRIQVQVTVVGVLVATVEAVLVVVEGDAAEEAIENIARYLNCMPLQCLVS